MSESENDNQNPEIINERLAKIRQEQTDHFEGQNPSQRFKDSWLITRLSQEVKSMELEVSQWRTKAINLQS